MLLTKHFEGNIGHKFLSSWIDFKAHELLLLVCKVDHDLFLDLAYFIFTTCCIAVRKKMKYVVK